MPPVWSLSRAEAQPGGTPGCVKGQVCVAAVRSRTQAAPRTMGERSARECQVAVAQQLQDLQQQVAKLTGGSRPESGAAPPWTARG
eukprot:1795867-Pyramimonas_sp.AAC.1